MVNKNTTILVNKENEGKESAIIEIRDTIGDLHL